MISPCGMGCGMAKATRVLAEANARAIPRGEYRGTWTAYAARVKIGDVTYEVQTDLGVRGIDVPCVVRVLSGEILVEAAK